MTSSLMELYGKTGSGEIITRLQRQIETTLADIVRPEEPFALLDFPDHDNVGDSAIYLGELAYFTKRKMRASYFCTVDSFDAGGMDKAIGDGPIYMHGGGNFGDIWSVFQVFREGVMKRYQGRRIVQLPQTIQYYSQEKLDQTARAIEKHGAYTLLVRDQRSYDLAVQKFQCDIRLCPDMAFCIGPVKSANLPSHEVLLHLRRDKETTGHDPRAFANNPAVLIKDWPHERRRHFVNERVQAKTYLTGGMFKSKQQYREMLYRNLAERRFQRGVSLLGQAKAVVTDRLHGHIMSTLMGVPHGVLDNSYGKTSGFISAWSSLDQASGLFTSLPEAVEQLSAQQKLKL